MRQVPAASANNFEHLEPPAITPFWQRLPLFFRYPFHAEPLLYMVALSLATLLGFVLPIPMPFDHLLVHFGVWLAFTRYAYKTLDQTAIGLLTPDQHRSFADEGRASLPYKQFAILMAMGFVLGLAQSMGGLVYGAVLIFVVLAFPASVMNLAITQSFWSGLNPLAAIRMMRTVGLPYLALCAFLFLLLVSQQTLQMILFPRVPGWMIIPMMNLVAMYFTLIMFNMMGYVVFQHHHLLGLSVASSSQPKDAGDSSDAIGRLIGAGQIDEALELAYEAQRVAPDDVPAHDRYHKLLALAGRDDRLMSHARTYLSLLLRKGMDDEALTLFRSMREKDAAVAPERPEQLLSLAGAARRRREYSEALALVKGFDKRFPKHAEIPNVSLFVAQVLSENLRQDASARQLLAVLLARYPEHQTSIGARQLLSVIDRMQASA